MELSAVKKLIKLILIGIKKNGCKVYTMLVNVKLDGSVKLYFKVADILLSISNSSAIRIMVFLHYNKWKVFENLVVKTATLGRLLKTCPSELGRFSRFTINEIYQEMNLDLFIFSILNQSFSGVNSE